MINQLEIGWLVGLLEGEGSFVYSKGTQVVQLKMTDEDIVLRYADYVERLTGQSVHVGVFSPKEGNRAPIFYCTITGERARIVMRTIVPYMGTRRKQRIWQCLNKYIPHTKTLKQLGFSVSELTERMRA